MRRRIRSVVRLRAASYQAPVPMPAGSAATAGELIALSVRAKGGAAKLRSIRTVKAVATLTLTGPGGDVDVETVTSIRYPGSFRTEVKRPGRPVAQVFHNGEFWIQSSNGVRQAPPSRR